MHAISGVRKDLADRFRKHLLVQEDGIKCAGGVRVAICALETRMILLCIG
jgi:hypothetical protein